MKHSLKEQVKGSLVRPLGFRVATGLSPTFKIPLISSVSSVPSGLVSTYTRSGVGTYIEDGLIKTAESGVIRFQNGRYLAEPATTNLIKNSQDLSLWSNSWTGGVTLTSGLDTIAGLPAFRLIQIDNIGDAIYGGDSTLLSLTAGTKYYASFLIKNFTSIRSSVAFWDTVKATMNTLVISWTSGIPSTYSSSTTITEIVYTSLAGEGGYLVSFAYTVPVGSSSHRFMFFPEVSVVATNGIIVTGVQLATALTSYIPTTAATVARAADVLYYSVGSAITQGQGSLYCEFVGSRFTGTSRHVLALSDGTTSNRINAYISSVTGNISLAVYASGMQTVYTTEVSILSTLNKIAFTYETNSVKFYVNGVLCYTDTSCVIPSACTQLSVGCSYSGASQLDSETGNVKYFKEVLTEAEAIKITTL